MNNNTKHYKNIKNQIRLWRNGLILGPRLRGDDRGAFQNRCLSARILLVTLFLIFNASCISSQQTVTGSKPNTGIPKAPKNVILMIGDGMGYGHVEAAGIYANGKSGTLSFEQLPYKGQMSTFSADNAITDSAASATAMATGAKVKNGVVSVRIPGDKKELKTVLEIAQEQGKAVGLVSTADISHATPACFATHDKDRDNYKAITEDYYRDSRPDVVLGGAQYARPEPARKAGYAVVENSEQLMAVDTNKVNKLWGQFGKGHMPYEYEGVKDLPHLSDMAIKALEILDNDPDGYFIMIEGARIDHAGHANDIKRDILETVEFSKAVQLVYDRIKNDKDTLLIVTADHETGGLKVVENQGKGKFPKVKWSTWGHTGVNVPIYAWGVNADLVVGVMDNTDLFWMVQDKYESSTVK